MAGWHMFTNHCVAAFLVTPLVAGDAFVFVQTFHGMVRKTNIYLFLDQLEGDTVIMIVHLDMIVDIDLDLLLPGKKIRFGRQWFESRSVKFFKHGLSGARQLLERSVIEFLKQFSDLSVKLCQTEKGMIP